jgi:O-6-methylguanine DNA methyltransferase
MKLTMTSRFIRVPNAGEKMVKRSRGKGGNKRSVTDGSPIPYGLFHSPVGSIYVAFEREKVVALRLPSGSERDFRVELSARTSRPIRRSDELVKPIVSELQQYFEGTRTSFSYSPDISNLTAFQRTVLNAAASIPYGETRTYAWLAGQADSPRAFRAAGQVMARNPVPLVIPCHRVIGSSGDLCGFGGGSRALELKRKLLAMEGIMI